MIRTPHTTRRPGAILLIVLVLLALFAVVGLTFVLYSQSEAVGARIHREAMVGTGDAPDPSAVVNSFFNQLIYDVPDYGPGLTSAMRGYGMGRMVFGYNPGLIGSPATPIVNRAVYGGYGAFTDGNRANVINYTANNIGDLFYDPEHSGTRTLSVANYQTPAAGTSPIGLGTYVGKNAAYTYPDRNNAYLAMMDPATGQIVIPSFHRPGLFGSLAHTNGEWTSATGRQKILRPRPYDHRLDSGDGRGEVSDFPYPPQNPDGTITGDLQNNRWANGIQQNDSVWIHANLPVVKWRGRELQPLIAALILPLDGRVNLGISGNQQDSTANPATSHGSQHGFTPHEINVRRVLPAQTGPGSITGVDPNNDAKNMPFYRNNNQPKPLTASKAGGVNIANFIPSVNGQTETMQDYSPLNWDAVNPQPIPNVNGLRTDPLFPTQGWDNNFSGSATRHPTLYNPYFESDTATAGVGGRTLKLLDLRQTGYRYSGKPTSYTAPLYGLTTTNSFTGAAPNHPSNLARALTTPVSNSFSYAGAAPTFASMTGNITLTAPASPFFPAMPTVTATAINPGTTPPGTPSDSVANNGYRSALAALGPVDLNRNLADYRGAGNFNVTLANFVASGGNIAGNSIPANRDRNALAKDIFDRLVLATGAPITGLDPNTGRPNINGVPPGPGYDALRYLAQIAVNIVDQIDNDDVCTSFVWNAVNPNFPGGAENDPQNFQPGAFEQRVVYGVEKTRLVLNEVYAEVTNDPADPSLPQQHTTNPFRVRFHIEVMNPLNAPINPPRTGGANPAQNAPLGKGDAQLRLGPPASAHSAYRFQIFDNSQQVVQQLFQSPTGASNVKGTVSLTPKAQAEVPASPKNLDVEPNDSNVANTGFRHLAPNEAVKSTDPVVFAPDDTAQVIGIGTAGGPNQLQYNIPNTPVLPNQIPNIINNVNANRHSVVMQRLANPYLTFDPLLNPYITVDSMHDIRALDAVRYGLRQVGPPPRPGTRPAADQPDPNTNAQTSHGRRAPMYSYRGTTAAASFAVDQQRSFASHNPNRFQQSFEWLNHFDRKLINATELLSVAGVKPHEQLHYFVTSANGQTAPTLNPTDKQHHLAPWYKDLINPAAPAILYRALSMLEVKPFTYGMPLGGRQPGRINVNAIWHPDVLKAALDANNGNVFTDADVDNLWNTMFRSGAQSRTPSFPNVTDADRPFKSLGALTSTGLADTILRPDPATGTPQIILRDAANRPHHYQKEEMLRKLYNNVTTTTDTYMVIFTIGYFEIRSPASGNRYIPYLGKEAFSEIPGDLRTQYAAVLDRSMIAADPAALTTPPQNLFMTELAGNYTPAGSGTAQIGIRCAGGDANGLYVDYEGRTTWIRRQPAIGSSLAANEVSTLVLGSGQSAATVNIPATATFTAPVGGSGIGYITFPAPITYTTPLAKVAIPLPAIQTGTLVTNVLISNPGPQASLDVNSNAAKLIIRDLQKLR